MVKNALLIGVGMVFLVLGAIGLFIPIWPTTPFVLLAAACFSATPRIKARIMKIGFFREYLENYEKRKGLSKKTVALSLSYLWGMLLVSMFLIQKAWVIGLLLLVGASVTTHILWVARPKAQKPQKVREEARP